MRIRLPRPRKPNINPHYVAVFIKTLAFFIAAFIIFMLFRINAQNHQLAQQSKDLAAAAKNISEQNQTIAKLNGKHIDCLADLFAKYTREARPITIDDLDQCKVTSAEAAALMSGSVDFTSLPSTTRPEPATNNQTNTPNATSQGEATPPTNQNQNPAPVQKPPVEILGVPVCVPLTNACVRQ